MAGRIALGDHGHLARWWCQFRALPQLRAHACSVGSGAADVQLYAQASLHAASAGPAGFTNACGDRSVWWQCKHAEA
jgi:hypothetical protein